MRKALTAMMVCIILAALLAGCQQRENPVAGTQEPAESRQAEAIAGEAGEEGEVSEEEPPPEIVWEVDAPENHGMDGGLLDEMHTALAQTEIYSAVTVKDGYIVDEYYKEGYDEASVFALHSVSKSFTSALVGIAIDQGLIEGVDTPISLYFPELAGTDKAGITIRHLLEHTAGFEWYEWGGDARSFFQWRNADNWVEFILNQPMVATPGTTFSYTTGGTHLLAAILQQATGMSAFEYGKEYLFGPLGMDSVVWEEDPQGIADGGNGILMSARDTARFGLLYLNGGSWDGQQLVPSQWVEESTSIQVTRYSNSGSYGYQWWVRPFGRANYDAYYAMGAWGQFIFVVPELELVTVITSNHPDDTYLPWTYFTDYILEACA